MSPGNGAGLSQQSNPFLFLWTQAPRNPEPPVGPRALLGRTVHRGRRTDRVVDAARHSARVLDRTDDPKKLSAAVLRDRALLRLAMRRLDCSRRERRRRSAAARLRPQAPSRDAVG